MQYRVRLRLNTMKILFSREKEVFMQLFEHLGRDKLTDILLESSEAPYDYYIRSADLMLIDSGATMRQSARLQAAFCERKRPLCV